jgi:hypothetical protein
MEGFRGRRAERRDVTRWVRAWELWMKCVKRGRWGTSTAGAGRGGERARISSLEI